MLGSKSGIVDLFNNGFYDYLFKYNVAMLIDSEKSLVDFLDSNQLTLTDKALLYCGLTNEDENQFNLEAHLQTTLEQHYQYGSRNKRSTL